MKNALIILTTLFSISSFAQIPITPSAPDHKATECPDITGFFSEYDITKKTLSNVVQRFASDFTSNGVVYEMYAPKSDYPYEYFLTYHITADGIYRQTSNNILDSSGDLYFCSNKTFIYRTYTNGNLNEEQKISFDDLNTLVHSVKTLPPSPSGYSHRIKTYKRIN